MGKFLDLTGKQFGRVTVLSRAGYSKDNHIMWKCQCSCGKLFETRGKSLTHGYTKSCGCWKDEFLKSGSTRKHGLSSSRIHHEWREMKDRCLNPKCKAYSLYGGRGISVYDKWKTDFMSFYDWAMDKHSSGIEEVENEAHELAIFVERCIKEYLG